MSRNKREGYYAGKSCTDYVFGKFLNNGYYVVFKMKQKHIRTKMRGWSLRDFS